MDKFGVMINVFAATIWGANATTYISDSSYGLFGMALGLIVLHSFIVYRLISKATA